MGAPEGARRRTEARGRLSSIDLLPEAAEEDVVWACQQLHERRRTQLDILDEFNGRLVDKGLPPVSRSAFNRKAVRLASLRRRLDEAHHVFAGIHGMFTPERIDQSSIGIGETIKDLILELLSGADANPKTVLDLARAYQAATQGLKISADRRHKAEAEERAAKALDKAMAEATAAGEKGLSAGRLAQLRIEIAGVRRAA